METVTSPVGFALPPVVHRQLERKRAMSRDLISNPLRLGILGCGNFAQRRILTALPEAPFVKVVCIHKRDPDEARVAARRFGIPRSCTTREELLNDPEIEAVMVTTINPLHEEDALACAQAGKHAIVDKPLAMTAESARRMVEAFRQARLKLLVGHSCRFRPSVRRAREVFRAGKLGAIQSMRGFFSVAPPAYNWRFDWELGGGVMRDLGIHLIDLFRTVSGGQVRSVMALPDAAFSPDEGRADRSMRVLLTFDGGFQGEISVSYNEYGRNGFEITGERAVLLGWQTLRQSDSPGESLQLFSDRGFSNISLPKSNMYAEELQHAASVFADDATPSISGEEGVANQIVLDAVYQSALERREVAVGELVESGLD